MNDLSRSKGLSRTLLGLSCFLLSACSVNETAYERNLQVPESFGSTVNQGSSKVSFGQDATTLLSKEAEDKSNDGDKLANGTSKFYESFNDAKLNALIERALESNFDINTAYLNIKRAEVELGLARANLHPTLNASMNASSRKDLSSSLSTTNSSSANFGISYELDLFKRLDAAERASLERFQATTYDYLAMRLSLIQRVSECYWQYAFAKEALQMAEEQLEASNQRLKLIEAKLKAGASDALEHDKAVVNHRNVEQSVYQRGYELTSAHNALAALLGIATEENLDQAITDLALERTTSPQVQLTLPASLLQNRPDLQAYESRIRAAYADVDAAQASFYPSFNLNAALNTGSASSLGRFFVDPVGTLGAAITFPFLNYNELKLQEEGTLVASEQAKLDFANGFINAVAEVSNALNDLSYQEQMLNSSSDEFALTKSNYQRIEERYKLGSSELRELLDASDELRSAQIKLLSSKRDLLTASMKLMITLGGAQQATVA